LGWLRKESVRCCSISMWPGEGLPCAHASRVRMPECPYPQTLKPNPCLACACLSASRARGGARGAGRARADVAWRRGGVRAAGSSKLPRVEAVEIVKAELISGYIPLEEAYMRHSVEKGMRNTAKGAPPALLPSLCSLRARPLISRPRSPSPSLLVSTCCVRRAGGRGGGTMGGTAAVKGSDGGLGSGAGGRGEQTRTPRCRGWSTKFFTS